VKTICDNWISLKWLCDVVDEGEGVEEVETRGGVVESLYVTLDYSDQ